MKKVATSVILSLMMLMVCVFGASAAGLNEYEQKLVDKLSQQIVVNGKTASLPAEYLNQAKNYLTSTADLTEAQYNAVAQNVDAAIALIKEQKNITNLSAINGQLIDYAKKASEAADLKFNYDGKNITITDANNNPVFKGDAVIKVTGASVDMTFVYVAAGVLVILMGASIFAAKKMKLFSK